MTDAIEELENKRAAALMDKWIDELTAKSKIEIISNNP